MQHSCYYGLDPVGLSCDTHVQHQKNCQVCDKQKDSRHKSCGTGLVLVGISPVKNLRIVVKIALRSQYCRMTPKLLPVGPVATKKTMAHSQSGILYKSKDKGQLRA